MVVAVIAASFLWRTTVWQNSIRQLMEMEPVETTYPWLIALIACLHGGVAHFDCFAGCESVGCLLIARSTELFRVVFPMS